MIVRQTKSENYLIERRQWVQTYANRDAGLGVTAIVVFLYLYFCLRRICNAFALYI